MLDSNRFVELYTKYYQHDTVINSRNMREFYAFRLKVILIVNKLLECVKVPNFDPDVRTFLCKVYVKLNPAQKKGQETVKKNELIVRMLIVLRNMIAKFNKQGEAIRKGCQVAKVSNVNNKSKNCRF